MQGHRHSSLRKNTPYHNSESQSILSEYLSLYLLEHHQEAHLEFQTFQQEEVCNEDYLSLPCEKLLPTL